MFEAVKLPASITNLNTGLTDVNGDDFPHFCKRENREKIGQRKGGKIKAMARK